MDDQRTLKTYGNTELPEGSEERPLVTFALFAYNQEKYIREAVEGAFSQTYSPLEIILSDDCSADRTYEIIDELAKSYTGPHKVRVCRAKRNRGLLHHVLSVSKIASGDILVVAAGDDVSLPSRTTICQEAFREGTVAAYSSDDIIIDARGEVRDWDKNRVVVRDSYYAQNPSWLHGATAAYRTKFLQMLPLPNFPVFYEDLVFQNMLRITKMRSVRGHDRLVKYRFHHGNLSERILDRVSDYSVESKNIRRWAEYYSANKYCLNAVKNIEKNICVDRKALRKVRDRSIFYRYISDWMHAGLLSRICIFFWGAKVGKLRLVFARVFGRKIFFLSRRMLVRNDG